MPRAISRFTRQSETYRGAPADNYEGAPTWLVPDDERVVQLLMTGAFGNTFYATADEITDEFIKAVETMASEDAEFLAKAIVYAREKGFMRSAPVVALVILRQTMRAHAPNSTPFMRYRDLFRAAWLRVMQTPKDVQQYVEVARGGRLAKGLNKTDKALIVEWSGRMGEYHAIKYAQGGQGYSLRDLLRLAKPVPPDDRQDSIFGWLALKGVKQPDLVPQIQALELLREGEGDPAWLIRENRLPHEAVTGSTEMTVEVWTALLADMPYFATLRNLNSMQRAGVFSEPEAARLVAARLADRKALAKAKILPFRFLQAYRAYVSNAGHDPDIARALQFGLDLSFANIPDIPGRVAIAPDVSGSMDGYAGDRTELKYVEIAGLFAGALLTKNRKATVLPFQSMLVEWQPEWSERSGMNIAQQVASLCGGGTNMGAPLERLIARREKVDIFIGITDNEDWQGAGFLLRWREYRALFPEAQAFLVRIDPYQHRVAPVGEPNVHFLYGWSDVVLSYIALRAQGSQVDAVRALVL